MIDSLSRKKFWRKKGLDTGLSYHEIHSSWIQQDSGFQEQQDIDLRKEKIITFKTVESIEETSMTPSATLSAYQLPKINFGEFVCDSWVYFLDRLDNFIFDLKSVTPIFIGKIRQLVPIFSLGIAVLLFTLFYPAIFYTASKIISTTATNVASIFNKYGERKQDYSAIASENNNQPSKSADESNQIIQSKIIPSKPSKFKDLRIQIKELGVDALAIEGDTESVLEEGVWHLSSSPTPNYAGNVVILGHRWKYLPPDNRSFFNLDKLQKNDIITLHYNYRQYTYKVREQKIVTPDQVEIFRQTSNNQITIVTCTPLYSTAKRLVVIGDLVE